MTVESTELVDAALDNGRLARFGDRLVCQGCGWSGPVAAVGLVAGHVRECGELGSA